jgi:putative peptide zinc metalloprotease protein
VQVSNQTDDTLKVDGRVQLNVIPEPNVQPVNLATAYSSCLSCQTLAVALQINLISKTATIVRPENAAVAVNYGCTDCDTIALAIQYDLSVDDPTQVPADVRQLVADMKQELAALHGQQDLTAAAAEQQVLAVIGQFQELAASLDTKRDEATDPTSPNASQLATGTPAATSADTPTATGSDTATPTDTPQPSDTPTPTDTPQPTDTATPLPSPTPTATP